MINIILATVLISAPLVPPQVKDAQSLYEWERTNFTYQNEDVGVDDWKEPTRTVKDKGGDCEDFSFFNETVLKQLCYQDVKAIAIYGKQHGEKYFHAITIFKTNNGKYRYFSNQFYSYFKDFESVTEIINFECPEWRWYATIQLPHKIVEKHIQTN